MASVNLGFINPPQTDQFSTEMLIPVALSSHGCLAYCEGKLLSRSTPFLDLLSAGFSIIYSILCFIFFSFTFFFYWLSAKDDKSELPRLCLLMNICFRLLFNSLTGIATYGLLKSEDTTTSYALPTCIVTSISAAGTAYQ